MTTGLNILCYKSKTLADGTHPLMIRVCKDEKKKYSSLGVSILSEHWDFKKNKPKRNCPNKSQIERIVSAKIGEYRKEVLELKSENKAASLRKG